MRGHRPARLELLQGTLDLLILRLELKGWIAATWDHSDKGKRARFYRLTSLGRKQLAAEQSKWDTLSRAMQLILRPATQEGE
jgi:PadR family transcriptional regulator PadR